MTSLRTQLRSEATNRPKRIVELPKNQKGGYLKVSSYYGEHTFDINKSDKIPEKIRQELRDISRSGKTLQKAQAKVVADAATEWAVSRGATHFCHWFQPLTGGTAEKHDAFLDLKNNMPIERLSASQLMQGEPDASSFPSGGVRSTFEARGYTSWDLSSPLFLMETATGRTLCIPTAFVSYHGDALDVKTPLLRSISKLSAIATRFCHLTGSSDVQRVIANCGSEQEYFLVDKAFYYARPDLVMTGRTLLGSMATRNQQLDDHYFGAIPERIRAFMDELNLSLHRLGIPAKTQHNEVAPGQFELAPIFEEANIAADHNQVMMATIKNIAKRHDFIALLHEKPFAHINGSGKHVNWSMSTDTGENLLEPGTAPHSNYRFLALVSIITEALHRHGAALRMSVATHANDHRLGANEAPPSILSVFLGSNLTAILDCMAKGNDFSPEDMPALDMGATQLAHLSQDNTDRNRTSPFAFTGNKFEFRAVGSSQSVGFPLSILNAAISDVLEDSTVFLEKKIKTGDSIDQALIALTRHWLSSASSVIFNGDGYSEEWVVEAKKRGLPNLKTSAESYALLNDEKEMAFLTKQGVYTPLELEMRYNVLLDNYNTSREIEFYTLEQLVYQQVLPAAIGYRKTLTSIASQVHQQEGIECVVELDLHRKVSTALEALYTKVNSLMEQTKALSGEAQEKSDKIAHTLMPLCDEIGELSNTLEDLLPDSAWTLPKYFDLLFVH